MIKFVDESSQYVVTVDKESCRSVIMKHVFFHVEETSIFVCGSHQKFGIFV